jgi:hypothetical protein
MSDIPSPALHAPDGRRLHAPGAKCAFSHSIEAKECPSCYELLYSAVASKEWWQWFTKRSGRQPNPGMMAARRLT